jgi:hypothetical protein|tara:strand:+ start:28 stop:453 length:426 start_codon:yes stop_codon:yes gene_type:complete
MQDLIQIRAVVEDAYSIKDLSYATRQRDYADARKVYSYIARRCTRYTYSQIGKIINRTHASILYANNQANELMETDENFRKSIRYCMHLCVNILNKESTTYKESLDLIWSNLSNLQQEDILSMANDMTAKNNGLKKEISYV